MPGVLELRLGVTRGALAPRAYTAAVNEITLSLEELDRVVEPDPKSRVAWFVERTDWYESGPTIQLRPDLQGAHRSTEDLYRPGRALLAGITSLHTLPKIPDDFTERTGLSEPITSARLRELVGAGLLRREPYQDPGARTRRGYRLTDQGAELLPALVALMQWGDRWLQPDGRAPIELRHEDCGGVVSTQLR